MTQPLFAGASTPSGALGLTLLRHGQPVAGLGRELTTREIVEHAFPRRGLDPLVNGWRERNAARIANATHAKMLAARRAAQWGGLPYFWSQLWLTLIRDGQPIHLGLAGFRVVTTAGVGYIVDAFQNLVELENMKFHGFGTGTTAEASGDTALVTELTTQYVGDVRPTGTTTEGASANIYRTVGTLAPDSGGTIAVTEHGVFSANAAGVLLDRTVFSAVNVVASADSLQATYELTLPAGS
jgi:hypothetical protein